MSHSICSTAVRALALAAGVLFVAAPAAGAGPPDVVRATLPNGLRVVVVRDSLAPVVTEQMTYFVGGVDTPAGFPGTAHAQEHMAASRAMRGLSTDQIATISALLGGDFDAETQQTVTQYYMTVPARYLEVALRVEAARMRDTLDLQSEWVQERGAIEQEVAHDQSSAFFRFYEKALAVLFAGTPYAQDPLGTRPSFQKTTGSMLRAFFEKWYAPDNALLVVAGDVEPNATLATVRAIFGPLHAHPVPAHRAVVLRRLRAAPLLLHDVSDFPVPIALLAYRMPGFRSADFAAADVASDVLASPRGDLYGLQAEGKALATGFEFEAFPATGMAFAYVATAPGGDTKAALDMIGTVIAKYQREGAPADLVEAAKRREIAQLLSGRDSIEGLADEWSDALAVQGLGSPDDAVAQYAKVTPADVTRVLRTYLVRGEAVAGILTPKPGAAPSGGAGFAVKDTFAPQNPKPVALPSWALALNAPPAVPPSLIDPIDQTLPNGIRLIVQPEHVAPTVTLSGLIRNERSLEEPQGKEGIDDVLSALFGYGTTTYDRVAFQAQLDAIAADVSAGTSFSLAVPSAGFDRGVQLLADDLLHPALPADAFAIVQKQTEDALAGTLTTPDYLAQRALAKALMPPGDPTLRVATPQTVGAVTLADVRAYEAAVYRPDETTIVVAGDVTPAQVRASIERWFGAWTASGPKPATELPPVPLNAASFQRIAAPGRTQATVTLRENVAVRRNDPGFGALELGDAILGGGFYATRFYRDLRRTNGLVYSVSAGVSADRTRGSYAVDFGSDPEKAARARAIVERDLRALAAVPPSAAETRTAKTLIVRDLSLSEGSVGAIAQGLVTRADAQVPLDMPWRRAREILALRPEDVRAAFAKYVDPSRFVEILIGPER